MSSYGIFAQRFSDSGAKEGSEFQVNTDENYKQDSPSIASLANGGFVVSWTTLDADDDFDVHAQRYSSTGTKEGSEFRVNTNTVDTQHKSDIAGLISGDFVIVWESYGQDGSNWGIYAQLYSSSKARNS